MTSAYDDPAQLLRQRAERLARAPAPQPADLLQALFFNAAGQDCALELRWLREVRPLRGIAMLPHPAPGVFGVADMRGRMVPLLDLATMLGLPAGSLPDQGKLVVVGAEAPAFALAAGELQGLRAFPALETQHRCAPLAPVRPESVRGMTASGYLLLDGGWLIQNFKESQECSAT
jgi:chemotaxis signal transduction protein